MASSPALSPDGSVLVFEWQDDLWSVPSDGGKATRITSHPARDGYPCFSPDGRTLYFSSARTGPLQLFSMPVEGGPATQHTFHSEGATLETISPDGTTAIVRGPRDDAGTRPDRLLEIDLRKESQERQLFAAGGQSARYSPDGKLVLFCRDGEQPYRKNYQGSRASSIWCFDRGTREFRQIVKSAIESRSPLWFPDGSGFYYVSEQDGALNLWSRSLKDETPVQLTRFKDDGVMVPALSRDGRKIVFRRGLDLWSYEPGSDKEPKLLEIRTLEDLPDTFHEVRKVTGTDDADFSPSGLELAFSAEGELWTMDTVLKEPLRLTETKEYERDPHFSKDGKWIYYLKDDGIEANYWRIGRRKPTEFWWRATSFEEAPVTKGPEVKSGLSFSPDGANIAYVSAGGKLCIANADGTSERVIHTAWNPPDYDWSPDGKWIVFSSEDDNFNRDIYLMPADGSREPFNLTRHPDFESSPRWSPDGRMIAFTGKRTGNRMGLYYVQLRLEDEAATTRDRKAKEAETTMKDDPLYRRDEPKANADEEPAAAEPKPEAAPKVPKPEKDKDAKSAPEVIIDFEGLSERIHKLDTGTGEPGQILWSHDSKHVLYQLADPKDKSLYKIEIREASAPTVADAHKGLPIRAAADNTLYWLVDRTPSVLKKGKLEQHTVATRFTRDRRDHQRLCFRLGWRTLRDRFYDPAMNGLDWNAMRLKYEDAAANAADSREFDRVMAMLNGELNASHLAFVSEVWPKPWTDEGAEFRMTRHTGIRFDHGDGTGPLKVGSVIPNSPAALCVAPVKADEIVVSIDGQPVDASTPETRYLNGRMDREMELVIRGADGTEREVSLRSIPFKRARELAESERIENNRKRTVDLSQGKLGYIHISKMFWDEFEEFERQIYAAGHGKDGLIIDVRDNGGGFITDHLLTVLCQPQHAITIPRGGGEGYPQDRLVYASWNKPIVVLCNQNSFSNAEVFSHAIKTLKRGALVGVPTAGGVISTGSQKILDAGTIRVPFRGWFLPGDGEDMELNGASPDYLVTETPADIDAGRDPQLAKAVEVLAREIGEKNGGSQPVKPKFRHGS